MPAITTPSWQSWPSQIHLRRILFFFNRMEHQRYQYSIIPLFHYSNCERSEPVQVCITILAFREVTNSFVSFGGTGKSGLTSMTIASEGQPVAQTAHPKHRSRLTCGTSLSPMARASGGHRSIQISQAVHRSGSNRG